MHRGGTTYVIQYAHKFVKAHTYATHRNNVSNNMCCWLLLYRWMYTLEWNKPFGFGIEIEWRRDWNSSLASNPKPPSNIKTTTIVRKHPHIAPFGRTNKHKCISRKTQQHATLFMFVSEESVANATQQHNIMFRMCVNTIAKRKSEPVWKADPSNTKPHNTNVVCCQWLNPHSSPDLFVHLSLASLFIAFPIDLMVALFICSCGHCAYKWVGPDFAAAVIQSYNDYVQLLDIIIICVEWPIFKYGERVSGWSKWCTSVCVSNQLCQAIAGNVCN